MMRIEAASGIVNTNVDDWRVLRCLIAATAAGGEGGELWSAGKLTLREQRN